MKRLDFSEFLKSYAFVIGVLKSFAILSCAIAGWIFGNVSAGLTAATTIIMIAPSDIPGNRKHHLGGIVIATLFVAISSVTVNFAHAYGHLWQLLALMALLTFGYAYISLYGARAAMVSIAGIFTLTLALVRPQKGIDILYNALYIFMAGAWYIFLVRILMWIRPRQYSEQLLAKCMTLTAKYLQIRALLIRDTEHRSANKQLLLSLQSSLNEEYEKLRAVLLDSRSKSGKTNYLQRQFLIFIEMVDIFELAIANPIPYEKVDKYATKNAGFLDQYTHFLEELSQILLKMAEYIGERKKGTYDISLKSLLEKQLEFKQTYLSISQEGSFSEEQMLLEKMYLYLSKQTQNIYNVQQIFNNYYTQEVSFRDEKSFRRFVSVDNYSIKRLADHFSFQSSFFRHALRLAIVTVIGYLIGSAFEVQNPHWILFTVYVIMRPGYGLTLKRSKDRALGTLIGAGFAFVLVYVCQFVLHLDYEVYKYIYGAAILMSMPFGYGLLQENFSMSAIFLTLYIVLAYALFVPDAMSVVQYRVVDTLIAFFLSVSANYLLFPSWEHKNYNLLIVKSLRANLGYTNELIKRAEHPEITTEYKVARKKAFLALANLNAGLQRMLQEPKSQQKNYTQRNEIQVLQQDFLSCVATLSTQLSEHPSPIIKDLFVRAIQEIQHKLQHCVALLDGKLDEEIRPFDPKVFQEIRQATLELFAQQDKTPPTDNPLATIRPQEMLFYTEQLNYLRELTENIEKMIKVIVTD
ncbi:FUSC family membrane protein [Capnocytophaga gingivalis]|jgi:putative membrane protein